MAFINGYQVSNSGGGAGRKDMVSVYLNGSLLARVTPPNRNPLGYIRQRLKSRYRADFVAQLLAANVSQKDIDAILTPTSAEAQEELARLHLEQARRQVAELEKKLGSFYNLPVNNA